LKGRRTEGGGGELASALILNSKRRCGKKSHLSIKNRKGEKNRVGRAPMGRNRIHAKNLGWSGIKGGGKKDVV